MDHWTWLIAQAAGAGPPPTVPAPPQSGKPSTDWLEKGMTLALGAVGGWISGTIKTRGQQRIAIDNVVQKLIELSMQYPHLERDSYCASWKKDGVEDDDKSRYENYCCLVFNTIEHAWELSWPWAFKSLRHRSVKKIVQVEEPIWRHRLWWDGDGENVDGYSPGFRAYVLFVLDKCKKERRQ